MPDFVLKWLKRVHTLHLLCSLLCVGRRLFNRVAANSEGTSDFLNVLQLFPSSFGKYEIED